MNEVRETEADLLFKIDRRGFGDGLLGLTF